MNVIESVYRWSVSVYDEQSRVIQAAWTLMLGVLVWMLFSTVLVTISVEPLSLALGLAAVIAAILVGVFVRAVRQNGIDLLEKHGRN